ncbi:MAG: hypothetical protein QME66_07795 [Candidatus Eisenbacteria bacterium]|nr:hypothetical protein [Candidatus Eisenbacteria bacterium]
MEEPQRVDRTLAWNINPVSQSKFLAVSIIVLFVAVAFGVYVSTKDYLFGVMSFVILFFALGSFFFPTSYVLDKDGILVGTRFSKSKKPWSSFQSFSHDRHGITLSPFLKSSWLEPYRVTRVRFRENREEVLGFVRERLGSEAERTKRAKDKSSVLSQAGSPTVAAGDGMNALSEQDMAIVDSLARRIVDLRMGVPAIVFLESSKPLTFLGSQVVVFFEPFVRTFFSVPNYGRFVRLMEDRKNVDLLMDKIEAFDKEKQAEEKRFRAAHPGLVSRVSKKVGEKLRTRGK